MLQSDLSLIDLWEYSKEKNKKKTENTVSPNSSARPFRTSVRLDLPKPRWTVNATSSPTCLFQVLISVLFISGHSVNGAYFPHLDNCCSQLWKHLCPLCLDFKELQIWPIYSLLLAFILFPPKWTGSNIYMATFVSCYSLLTGIRRSHFCHRKAKEGPMKSWKIRMHKEPWTQDLRLLRSGYCSDWG